MVHLPSTISPNMVKCFFHDQNQKHLTFKCLYKKIKGTKLQKVKNKTIRCRCPRWTQNNKIIIMMMMMLMISDTITTTTNTTTITSTTTTTCFAGDREYHIFMNTHKHINYASPTVELGHILHTYSTTCFQNNKIMMMMVMMMLMMTMISDTITTTITTNNNNNMFCWGQRIPYFYEHT